MLLKLQDHFPLRVSDWFAAGILTSWGMAVLAASPAIWSLTIYANLAKITSQDVWGCFALSLGIVRIGALFINGAMRRSPHARAVGAFLSMFIWMQMTFAILTLHAPGISIIFYPWLLAVDCYNVYRAAQDAKLSDSRAKALRGAPHASSA